MLGVLGGPGPASPASLARPSGSQILLRWDCRGSLESQGNPRVVGTALGQPNRLLDRHVHGVLLAPRRKLGAANQGPVSCPY